MLSRETLRYKEIQSEILYRREIVALRGVRTRETHIKEGVRMQEEQFWKAIAQRSSTSQPSLRVGESPRAGDSMRPMATPPPLELLIAAHSKLIDAKRAHAQVVVELEAGGLRVSQSDALRSKVHELQSMLQRRSDALRLGRGDEELVELLPNRALGDTGRTHQIPTCALSAVRSPSQAELSIQSNVQVTAAQVQAIAVEPQVERARLTMQCTLANGTPFTVALTQRCSGSITVIVESPHVGFTGQLARERVQLLSKLSMHGVPVAELEVRSEQVMVEEGAQLPRRRRTREGERDEDSIA